MVTSGDEPVRVLAIAPYDNLKARIDEVALGVEGVSVTCRVGDLERGRAIAEELQDGFDVIVSRGGTARRIREIARIPLIEIDISLLDILRVVKLANLYREKTVYIGFPNVAQRIEVLSELLQADLDIVTLGDEHELPEMLERLREQGCSMVVGDTVTVWTATHAGFNSFLIESGEESIAAALFMAGDIGRFTARSTRKSRLFGEACDALGLSLAVGDASGHRIAGMPEGGSVQGPSSDDGMWRAALAALGGAREGGKGSPSVPATRYDVDHGKTVRWEYAPCGEGMAVAAFREPRGGTGSLADPAGEAGCIRAVDVDALDDDAPTSSVLVGGTRERIDAAARSEAPVVISGERGTGKDRAVRLLERGIGLRRTWEVDLTSPVFTERSWALLMGSPSSPLLGTESLFVFWGVERLGDARLRELTRFIRFGGHASNRWVLVFRMAQDGSGEALLRGLVDEIEPFHISLKPLRRRHDDFSSILSLYLYAASMRLKRDVVGFEPAAAETLRGYDWPSNLRQLKRAVGEMVARSTGSFISDGVAREVLEEEREHALGVQAGTASVGALIGGASLAEIERRVVRIALAQNGGNKTRTATQLGIGRSTLWRMLR